MIALWVEGLPAPKGSLRHVGNGRLVDQSKRVGPWRKVVAARLILMGAVGLFKPGEPVAVTARFYLPRPKSHHLGNNPDRPLRDTAPAWPTGRTGDIDKLSRTILDEITAQNVWKDDAQCVQLRAEKWYADGPSRVGMWLAIEHATTPPGRL
jgi:crossover junction endodeoxyribonuclease RusA